MVIGTKEAVTLFNKKGTEVEQEREGNIRKNTVYSRKYYLAAMTNEAKAVKIIVGSAKPPLMKLFRPRRFITSLPALAMWLKPPRPTPRLKASTRLRRRKEGGDPRCVIK